MYKRFWVFTRRCCLVRDQLFVTAPLVHIETLMMGHTNSTETLVPDQTTTPGKNLKNFSTTRKQRRNPSIA